MYSQLFIIGAPRIVPNVIVNSSTNGNNVILTLSWGEPFNNLDPIVNYTVSCSGNVTCPPNFTTTDNTTRSYTITNLTPMTTYTFSVVATNSIGNGEPYIVTIGDPPTTTITTTTTTTVTTTVTATVASSVDITSVSMSCMPNQSITATTSLLIESSFATTISS